MWALQELQDSLTVVLNQIKEGGEIAKDVIHSDINDLAGIVSTVGSTVTVEACKQKVQDTLNYLKGPDSQNQSVPQNSGSESSGSLLGALNSFVTSALISVEPAPVEKPRPILKNYKQEQIENFQLNLDTYLADPPPSEPFMEFDFVFSEYAHQISALLASNAGIKTIHDNLVPASLSNDIFWKRYFFKLRQLERRIDDQRRGIIKDLGDNLEADWSDGDDDDNDDDNDNEEYIGKAEAGPAAKSDSLQRLDSGKPLALADDQPNQQPAAVTIKRGGGEEDWADWD